MNFTTLVTEIATWLQQDLSGTNPVWTEAKVQAAVQQSVREFSALRLRDTISEGIEYTTSEINLPANFIAAFRVSVGGVTVPILDIQKLDLTGISSPMTGTGSIQYVMDTHNSDNVRVLRLVPNATGTSDEIDLWYKAQMVEPSADDDLIELNAWMIPWLKFRSLSILFAQDGAGKDKDRVEMFDAIVETLASVLTGIYPVGNVI